MSVVEFLEPTGWFRQDGGPRYLQLRQRLIEGVEEGILAPGSPLPPEREIASITEFSRVTVRKAIASLAEDGTIVQRQGSGSYISSEQGGIDQRLSRLTSFTEDMERQGRHATSRWLERGVFLAASEEIEILDLVAHDSVSRIARLRLADDEPMAIERASLPVDILPNPLDVESSLYEVLESRNLRPVRALQRISAVNIAEDDADVLAVAPGSAALRIVRISYLPDGRVAEFTRSLYRGDAYTFIAELLIGGD